MKKQTRENYNHFANRVLARTDGGNIHEVQSNLGIILNDLSNYQYGKKENLDRFAEVALESLEKAFAKIKDLTGVDCDFEF